MKTAVVLPLVLVSFVTGAQASVNEPSIESTVESTVETVQLDPQVRVESVTRDGQDLEVVHLGNGQDVEIPVDSKVFANLNPGDAEAAKEEAREVYEIFVKGITSNEFSGVMDITPGDQAQVVRTSINGQPKKRFPIFRAWLRQRITTGAMAMNMDMYKPAPEGLKANEKLVRFLKLSWQFVLVETVHAAIDYYDQLKTSPRLVEFGVSIDFKIEPQIFIGKFNPTQKVKALRNSYALGFEFSFDKAKKRASFRTRLRREKGSGGLGLPAVKFEAKLFQTDGTHRVQGGKSWYPVSPPVASFVFDRDHGGHYFAQGLTFGFNTGDLIPGSTLTNTFADYQQKENVIKFSQIPKSLNETAHKIFSHGPSTSTPEPMMCSAIFG